MKIIIKMLFIIVLSIGHFNGSAQKRGGPKLKKVYRSKDLVVSQIAGHSYVHTSFLQTNDFGKVPCNGLVVRNGNDVIIFDTPTNDKSAAALIKWIQETLHCKISAVIPTHFHNDCLGGLGVFHEQGIPSYAYFKTIALAKENNFTVPQNSFCDSLILNAGDEQVIASFRGEGHTRDNVVGYFPVDHIMFGGCLIKELGAGKGYLGDANVTDWSGTVEWLKKSYPDVRIVVPGHGAPGDKRLLDYTTDLFRER